MSIGDSLRINTQLTSWWKTFLEPGPELPFGQRFPELILNVPIVKHRLVGRFDLFFLYDDQAYIYDWKNEVRPQYLQQLANDLQTQIYSVLALEGRGALPKSVSADKLSLTYWYVNGPNAKISISYDQARDVANWDYLQRLVAEIDSWLGFAGEWEKRSELIHCQCSAYQVLCNRLITEQDLSSWQRQDQLTNMEPENF